jgi:hypothetical protein
MKNVKPVLALSLCALLVSSCAELKGYKVNLKPVLPIAVVSITSNKEITWEGEDKTFKSIFTRSKDKTKTYISDADNLINDGEAMFWDSVSRAALPPSAFLAKAQVQASQVYQAGPLNRHLNDEDHLTASGYRCVNYKDKQFVTSLCKDLNAKGLMFINFTVTKVLAKGIGKTGSMRAQVEMDIIIEDSTGKVLYDRGEEATSYDTVKVSFGNYVDDDLQGICKEAMGSVIDEFLDEFKEYTL